MRDDPRARARRVEVGRRLRELRQERGLAQAALARAARMGQATLSNYEKGRRDILCETLVNVAGALGLSIGEVLDVDHILIVRDERLREAVSILVRTPDVLDSIVGPRPPPPPRPRRRRRTQAREQDGVDAESESSGADDASSGTEDESTATEDEANGAESESSDADDESSDAPNESNGPDGESSDVEDEGTGADDPGDMAQRDTGTQA